jgi:SnoaL-like domain
MGTPEFLRWPIAPLHRDRRALDERLALLAPEANRRLSAAVLRLRLGSRMRKALLTRSLRTGLAAASRHDYERLFLPYAQEFELHIDYPGWATIDLEPFYRGVDGLRRLLEGLSSGFADLRWEPREVVDAAGGRFACRMDFVGIGQGSGVETIQEQWHVYLVERGLIVRQRILSTEEEARGALAEPGRILSARA